MKKDLASLLKILSPTLLSCKQEEYFPTRLSGITSYSGDVEKDGLFCAVEGASFDGNLYIDQAWEKGAKVIIYTHYEKTFLPDGAVFIRVKDSRLAWALCSSFYYDSPAEKLNIYAVTGTNGKTSIAFLIKKLLQEAKKERTGLISTVEYDCGSSAILEGVRTTPDAKEIQKYFAQMVENSCKNCVMEASSHGLHQKRMGSTMYSGAVFTNLTGDHLDYHGTMEEYYQAKKLLFSSHIRENAPCIINTDDQWGKRLAEELLQEKEKGLFKGNILTLSRKDKNSSAFFYGEKLDASGSFFILSFKKKEYFLHTSLIGLHNIYNVAQAFLLALEEGAEEKIAIKTLGEEKIAPPGRLEKFLLPSGAFAYVDYAHTDDALARVTETLAPLKKGLLYTLFGCGGDRDRTKRPRMALAASIHSDKVMVTSDNPRREEPGKIIEDIVKGFPENAQFSVEEDRKKAIHILLSLAKKGDIVLIAGKGHENYQERNGVKTFFDDREEIKRFISENE